MTTITTETICAIIDTQAEEHAKAGMDAPDLALYLDDTSMVELMDHHQSHIGTDGIFFRGLRIIPVMAPLGRVWIHVAPRPFFQ